MNEITGFKDCPHKNIRSSRCEPHRGWCGVCEDCGKSVHAPDDVFRLTGKEVYQTSLHKEHQ